MEINPTSYSKLLDIIERMDAEKMPYWLQPGGRERFVCVIAVTPGRLWEIEVFEDDCVEALADGAIQVSEYGMAGVGPESDVDRMFSFWGD